MSKPGIHPQINSLLSRGAHQLPGHRRPRISLLAHDRDGGHLAGGRCAHSIAGAGGHPPNFRNRQGVDGPGIFKHNATNIRGAFAVALHGIELHHEPHVNSSNARPALSD